jgi:hypothetical protein
MRWQPPIEHGTVLHRGDSQRSQLPIGLRDIDTPQRLRLIRAGSKCEVAEIAVLQDFARRQCCPELHYRLVGLSIASRLLS